MLDEAISLSALAPAASDFLSTLSAAMLPPLNEASSVDLGLRLGGSILGFLYLLSPPNVMNGLLDRLFLKAIDARSEDNWGPDDISPKVGRTLGKGTFGLAYEAFTTSEGRKKLKGRRDEEGRVVIKRCLDDDQADIEAYFNRRVRRLGKQAYFATFLGAQRRAGDVMGPGRLLVWNFEGSRTLESYMMEPSFPLNLESLVLYRRQANPKEEFKTPKFGGKARSEETEKREVEVIKRIAANTLTALKTLHDAGVVHRDVKPANILVAETAEGAPLRLIDLGACVDLRNGFNFDPEKGLLDPRYAPPEQYIMPQDVPKPPKGVLALLASPFLWQAMSPDRFDTYSVGIMLMQMAIPQLRNVANIKVVSTQLKDVEYDVQAWRERYGTTMDFSLLDRCNFAGWDLVCQLVRSRDSNRRGRFSASDALSHRYFRPESLSSIGSVPAGSRTLVRK